MTLGAAATREAAYMLDLLAFVIDRGFLSYCILIDSLCVAAILEPKILQTKRIHVDVETQGKLTLGQTVVDTRANFRWSHLPLIEAACDIEACRAWCELQLASAHRADALEAALLRAGPAHRSGDVSRRRWHMDHAAN